MTLIFFIGGLTLLYIGGEILVASAAALGKRLHMSPLVAGLTIVAFATSAPELAISVSAAVNDLPGLAIGNVIGSNICNIALILGIVT
ncbi:MAG: sodium:calcium antiporter, partial [Gammaproteobacteria bacterium]